MAHGRDEYGRDDHLGDPNLPDGPLEAEEPTPADYVDPPALTFLVGEEFNLARGIMQTNKGPMPFCAITAAGYWNDPDSDQEAVPDPVRIQVTFDPSLLPALIECGLTILEHIKAEQR